MKADRSVIDQSLFSLSWPIFIDIFLHFSTLLINTYMIGHESISMVAATTIGNQFFDIFIPIFNFIGIGCSVVVAQHLGAKNYQQARHAIHLSIAFNLVLGLICYLFILLAGYHVLIVMNTPKTILDLSYDYFHILGICLFFEAIGLIIASCIRVYGYSKSVMYVSLIMNITTVVGNILVLYGYWGFPKLGLVGVAWSTVIGRVVNVLLLSIILFCHLKIKAELRLFIQWNKNVLKQILQIGLPSAGENLLWTGQVLVMTAFISLMGETALAAQALYLQLAYFMMLFAIAIGIGNEIIVGHLVGAKQFELAYKRTFSSLKLGMIVTVVVVLPFFFFRELIVILFTENRDVMRILLPIFILSIFLEPGRTQNIIMVNALRAAGDARFPFYMAIIFMWGVAIPIGYILGITFQMGLLGIWIAFACDEWLRGLANAWRWKSKKWQNNRLNIDS